MTLQTSKNMINRKQQRQEIARLFDEPGDRQKFKLLEFYGIGGLGKTRILNAAKEECRARGYPFVVIDFLSFYKQSAQHPELDVLLRICDSLDKYSDFTLSRLSVTSLDRNGKGGDGASSPGFVADQLHLADFRSVLAETLYPQPFILVLDSIEHCPDDLFDWLGRELLAPMVAEAGFSSIFVFLAGRGRRVRESQWPPSLKRVAKSLRLDPLDFTYSLEHIRSLPSGNEYSGAAHEIYALSNGHSYSTESIIGWLSTLGVKVDEVGAQRAELARRLLEEVIAKYILSDADEWVLPLLEVVCYFRWFTPSYISEFIQKYRPDLGKDLPALWYSVRLVDLQKRPLHLVYLDRVHYRLEPTLQKLLHIVSLVLDPEEAKNIHSEAVRYLRQELEKQEAQSQKGSSSDNITALLIIEILYHKANYCTISGEAFNARAELAQLLQQFFSPKSPRDLELLEFLRNSITQDTELSELLTSQVVQELLAEIDVFLMPVTTPGQPFRLSHLIINHIGPSEYQVSWYQANHVVIPVEKVVSTQQFLLSEWQNETTETGKTAFTAYLPNRSQTFVRTMADDCAVQLSTNRVDIPWELLHDDNEFLCLRRPVGRIPQALQGAKELSPRPPGPLRALIVGNPSEDLEGAEQEAEAIAEQLSRAKVEVDLLLRREATTKQFARKIRNGTFDLIHFAGHAYFEPKVPDLSGLMFWDNPMPASELSRHLSSRAFVFLSACEAGMASTTEISTGMMGDFIAGIATSILYGGAIGCIAPMWDIEDGLARDFSLSFYKHLLSGTIVGESLRQARLALRTADCPEDAWKAWVLYGDPTLPLSFGRTVHNLHG